MKNMWRAPSTCRIGSGGICITGKRIKNSSPSDTADFGPELELLRPSSSELGGSDMIATEIRQVVDLIVGGQKALRLAGRFELLHL